jgi:pimeloyl-ACP methyl ester carboxylesterase
VIDDFAHHPSAIQTTVDGLRARLAPGERILAVIEPRSNTMKLGAMKAVLPASLAGAERTFCFAGGLGWDAAEALAPLGERASVHHDLDELVAAVVREARRGDRVLVMSTAASAACTASCSMRSRGARPDPMLIYLHGFRSSPSSFKAQMLAERMARLGRAADYACPALPVSPRDAIELVERTWPLGPGDTLIGSSLGGCYATRLAERHGCRAVLLNPATRPAAGLAKYVGSADDVPRSVAVVRAHVRAHRRDAPHRGRADQPPRALPADRRDRRRAARLARHGRVLPRRDAPGDPGQRPRAVGLRDYVDAVLAFAGIRAGPD